MILRDCLPADLGRILELNQAEVPHLSTLTAVELAALVPLSSHFHVLVEKNELAGFLIAMDESSAYQSMNYQWFKARYPQFTYVDRIAIAPAFQRRGLGRMLYDRLAESVRGRSPLLACEVNLKPPNPESITFHQRIGFHQVGTQDTEGGKKTVSLLIRDI